MIETVHAKVVKREHNVCSEGTKLSQIAVWFFFPPKTKLFLCSKTTIELKDYFKQRCLIQYEREENYLCSATMPKSLCSFGNCSCVYLSRLQDDLEVQRWQPWFGEGAWLWASEHSSSAVNTAATHCPQGKAEQMVFPSLPPATLKERDIFCSTCVAQGQNCRTDCLLKSIWVKLLKGAQRTVRYVLRQSFSKLFFSKTIGAIGIEAGCKTLLKVGPLKFGIS